MSPIMASGKGIILMKKFISVMATLILLLEIGGCGNPSPQNDGKTEQADESSQSSAVLSLESAAGSDSPAQSRQPGYSSDPAGDTPSRTQQNVLNQIRSALETKGKVPLMLPTGVPIEKGRYLTATTTSLATNYKVNLYETGQPAEMNSPAASKGTLIAAVEGTEYKDASGARNSISSYEKVDTSNYGELLDLGHSIKAVGDAGLGHEHLVWNEGRWCIRLDSPIDPAYQNKEYPDNGKLAKNIVAYLENHMLPAPQKIGVISVSNWNRSLGTTVQWQNDRTVYQISSEDPMTALEVAVAMKLK